MNRHKTVVVVQGPSEYVDQARESWKGFDIIWSTWQGNESRYRDSDLVLFNSPPQISGIGNVAWQRESTLHGLRKAKELGFEYALKWRSDMVPNNANKLIELFDPNALNFLAWHDHGYFVDYFMYGSVDSMLSAWEFGENEGSFAEEVLTKNIYKKGFKDFRFIVHELSEDLDVFWIKYGISLHTYRQQSCYRLTNLF